MTMKMNQQKRYLVLLSSAGLLAAAAGFGAYAVPTGGEKAKAESPDVAGLLGQRSPGMRMAGAETNKYGPIPATAITPISAPRPQVLSERDGPEQKIAMAPPEVLAPPPAIGAAQAPVPPTATAPAAVPAAAVPVAVASASGIGLAALLPVIPAAIAIGSGGGGGQGSSSFAPAVPEPQTWMMMITGFGLLGLALRRRRRQERGAHRSATPQLA